MIHRDFGLNNFLSKKKIDQKKFGPKVISYSAKVDQSGQRDNPFPDPVGYFRFNWQSLWILQVVWRCRQWAGALARLYWYQFQCNNLDQVNLNPDIWPAWQNIHRSLGKCIINEYIIMITISLLLSKILQTWFLVTNIRWHPTKSWIFIPELSIRNIQSIVVISVDIRYLKRKNYQDIR